MVDYDVIIIGAGPAALSASVYCARAQLKALVLGFPHQSFLEKSHAIGNYLGFFESTNGPALINRFVAHSKKYNVPVMEEEVVHAEKNQDGTFTVKTAANKKFTSKALIIASGMLFKKSGIAKEDEFVGKGIHYCVACDGPLYKNKKAAVIGSGNYAAEEAIEMTAYTKDVIILSQREFTFSREMEAEVKKNRIALKRISPKSFAGNAKGMLDYILLDTGEKLRFDAAFVAVGTASGLAFANKLGIDYEGSFLRIDRDGRTNVERVYAAGGCTGGNIQVAKSVGEGCNAAISCIKDLKGLGAYTDYA